MTEEAAPLDRESSANQLLGHLATPKAEPWEGFRWNGFDHVWGVAQTATMHDEDYARRLWEVTNEAIASDVGNAVAEFGVAAAGLSLLMEVAIRDRPAKVLHLYDSFRGLPDVPDPVHDPGLQYGQFCFGHADGWIILMAEKRRFMFIGQFRDYMIPEDAVYDVVHLDVKMYRSYLDGIPAFLAKLRPGGLLVLGDYGDARYPGCRAACEELGVMPEPDGPLWVVRR